MSRKDYILIAATIRDLDLDTAIKRMVASEFARELAMTNERFDSDKFVLACMEGVK